MTPIDQASSEPNAQNQGTGVSIVERILALFREQGANDYLGEEVSQTEHMVQSAMAAERAGAPDSQVAAALLHDVGHFLHAYRRDAAEHGIDSRHEEAGAHWLAPYFPPAVVEPVRLHVAAKRYLCATEGDYFDQLTPASVHSLELQGGPMSAAEVAAFRDQPFFEEAVAVRRWDDVGKVKDMEIPPVEAYRPLLERLATV